MRILQMVRRFSRPLCVALLTALLLFLQSLFTEVTKPLGLLLLFSIVFLVVILVDYLERRYQPSVETLLSEILRSCARDSFEHTTVGGFLLESREADLGAGDEVHILTNSLEGYDLSLPALQVIAANLRDGVRYVYYLPSGKFPGLAAQKKRLIQLLTEGTSGLPITIVQDRLVFYTIDHDALYNFAIVIAKGVQKGYWYITTPSRTEKEDPDLVIVPLRRDLQDDLYRVMETLRQGCRSVQQGLSWIW